MKRICSSKCTGTLIFDNGAKYVGDIENGMFHGQGTYFAANGQKYEGEFANDMLDGHGTLTYKNGDVFTGEFRKDKKNGFGVTIHPDGTRHEANYIDGKEVEEDAFDSIQASKKHNSQYDYEWEDGSYYIGSVVNGKPNGLGTRYYPDGKEVYGVWEKGYLTYAAPRN